MMCQGKALEPEFTDGRRPDGRTRDCPAGRATAAAVGRPTPRGPAVPGPAVLRPCVAEGPPLRTAVPSTPG